MAIRDDTCERSAHPSPRGSCTCDEPIGLSRVSTARVIGVPDHTSAHAIFREELVESRSKSASVTMGGSRLGSPAYGSLSSSLAMRGTPFGQPILPPETGGHRIASKVETAVLGSCSITGGFRPRIDEYRGPRLRWLEKMRGRVRGGRVYGARSRDQRITDFKHAFEANRSVRCDGLAQRIIGEDNLHPCRLAVIPFYWVVRPVRTDHAVPRGDLVPQQGARRARCADPGNIDGKPISMKRMEFVGEAANAECRWPISREKSGEWQPRCSRLRNGGGKPPDEFWMQPPDRAFGPLPRHGVARRRRLDQIGAGARRLVGFLLHVPDTHPRSWQKACARSRYRRTCRLDRHFQFLLEPTRLSRQAPRAQQTMPRIR